MLENTSASTALRERRARRALAQQGMRVHKDRARSWNSDHHGGYMLVDANNCLVGGPRYDLTLDDLESYRVPENPHAAGMAQAAEVPGQNRA